MDFINQLFATKNILSFFTANNLVSPDEQKMEVLPKLTGWCLYFIVTIAYNQSESTNVSPISTSETA